MFFLVPCTCQPTNPSMECCRTPGVVASSLDKTTDASSMFKVAWSHVSLAFSPQLLFHAGFQPTNQNKLIISSRTAVFSHLVFRIDSIDNCVVPCTICGITVTGTRLQGFQQTMSWVQWMMPRNFARRSGWNEMQESPNQGICRPPPNTTEKIQPLSLVIEKLVHHCEDLMKMMLCMTIQTEFLWGQTKKQTPNATWLAFVERARFSAFPTFSGGRLPSFFCG